MTSNSEFSSIYNQQDTDHLPPKKSPGRPSSYSKKIADEIYCRISEGQSLRRICLDAHMPNKTTVLRWLSENSEFRTQYARARENQAESLFDEALDIAREHEEPAKARVIVDTLKWAAGKLQPKKYGDKIEHRVEQEFIPLDELERRMAESLARQKAEQIYLEENFIVAN